MKTLCIVNKKNDPMLAEYFEQLKEIRDRRSRELKTLCKQVSRLMEDGNDESQVVWTRIETYLKKADLLPPEYSDKTHCLHFDGKTGELRMYENDEAAHAQMQELPPEIRAMMQAGGAAAPRQKKIATLGETVH